MKLECLHADTCLSSYWGGHHLPHVAVCARNGMTLAELKRELKSEVSQGAIAGQWSDADADDAWYDAAYAAIGAIELKHPGADNCFPDLESFDPDAEENGCESVMAWFVFRETDD